MQKKSRETNLKITVRRELVKQDVFLLFFGRCGKQCSNSEVRHWFFPSADKNALRYAACFARRVRSK